MVVKIMLTHTLVHRFTLDSDSPAATMIASSNFEKLGSNLDIVRAVFDDLYTAFSGIILRPGIAVQVISLVARMARF